MKRHITSIILVIVLAAFMALGYFVSPIFVDMLVMIFFAGSMYEMYTCLKKGGYKMFKAPPLFVLATLYPVFYVTQYFVGKGDNRVSAGIQGILIVLLAGALLCLTIFTFTPSKKSAANSEATDGENQAQTSDEAAGSQAKADDACGLGDLFANIFLIVYPTLFLSAAFVISYKYSAFFAILFAILVPIVGSDLFAYLFGKAIGGRKLCPSISPKKTVAGAVGGVIGGVVVAVLLWVIFEYVGGELAPKFIEKCGYTPFIDHANGGLWKSALIYASLGAMCAAISELGDLAASRIKRALGIKDYGNIFPGHGGFLDRIDSVMYSLVLLLIAFSIIYAY